MIKPLISIIIPVFNAEKYINDCIKSILCQTFGDWELVIVNDGSTDNSGKICDGFSTNDDRVQTFHTINSGVTAARTFGIKHAKGEFLCFVDADDFLPPNALECLYQVANECDIAVGGYSRIYNERKKDYCRLSAGHFSNKEYLQMLLSGNWRLYGPVAKLFRKDLFSEGIPVIPKQIRVGEDLLMNVYLALRATSVVFISDIVYYYNQISTSATHTFEYTIEYMRMFVHVLDEILKNGKIENREELLEHYKLSMFYNVMLDDVNEEIDYHLPELRALCNQKFALTFKECLIVRMIMCRFVRIAVRTMMNAYRNGNLCLYYCTKLFLR